MNKCETCQLDKNDCPNQKERDWGAAIISCSSCSPKESSTVLTVQARNELANKYPCLDFDFPEDGGKTEVDILLEAQDAHTRSELTKQGWKSPEECGNCHTILSESVKIFTRHQIAEWLERWADYPNAKEFLNYIAGLKE